MGYGGDRYGGDRYGGDRYGGRRGGDRYGGDRYGEDRYGGGSRRPRSPSPYYREQRPRRDYRSRSRSYEKPRKGLTGSWEPLWRSGRSLAIRINQAWITALRKRGFSVSKLPFCGT